MKKGRSFIIIASSTAFCFLLCLFLFGITGKQGFQSFSRVLSDSFFVTAGVTGGIALIAFAVREGAFSINGISRRSDILHNKAVRSEEETERGRWVLYLAVDASVCLAAAIIFMFFA